MSWTVSFPAVRPAVNSGKFGSASLIWWLSADSRGSFLLDRALQRMLVLTRQVHDLRHFGLSNFIGVDAAYAHAAPVHVQHDPGRFLARFLEEPFKYVNDELHWRVI